MSTPTSDKIWRYMTLSKLISLLSSKAIYFACPSQFADPYEGFYPASHMRAFEPILQKAIDDSREARNKLASLFPYADLSNVDNALATQIAEMRESVEKSRLKFGVSCWHQNNFESEAMWRLYSTSEPLIAIESTITRLHNSMTSGKKVTIDNVRYIDFENDPIETGHKHYGLFLKRKSFDHEREVRATILLHEVGKGELVKYVLEQLIYRIHISPFSPSHFADAVRISCAEISKLICQSTLFAKPPAPFNLR